MDRALSRVVLVLCVVLGAPLWAGAAPRRLVSVELREESSGRWLSITSDRPPNFTSFKLSHPSRVVVDFPETAATASKQAGPGDGLVAGWSVQPLGSDGQVVARLTVELRKDSDYTLTSSGNGVELRFVSSLARPLVALENEHVEPQVAPAPTPEVAVAPVAPTLTPAEKARLAKEEAHRQAVEAARARKAALLAEAEAKKQRLAEAQRRQLEAAVAKREKEADARRQQAERVATVRRQKAEAARAEVDRLAALKRAKSERAAELTAQRAAAAKAEKERVAAAARQRTANAQAARERTAADKRQKAEAAEEARLAKLRGAPTSAPDAHVATFGQMGFRRVSDNAEVLLHTSHPVEYSMREEEGRVVLTLEHTRILVANNKLALETSYFGTPVARIIPHDRPRENRVDVEFVLSTPVPYEIKPEGEALSILFRNPPVVRAEADAAPGMTAEP